MKYLTKILSLILALCFTLSLTSCGNADSTTSTTQNTTPIYSKLNLSIYSTTPNNNNYSANVTNEEELLSRLSSQFVPYDYGCTVTILYKDGVSVEEARNTVPLEYFSFAEHISKGEYTYSSLFQKVYYCLTVYCDENTSAIQAFADALKKLTLDNKIDCIKIDYEVVPG